MASARIRIGDEYYLLATALAQQGRQLVLNHGDSFAIVNELGDCPLSGQQYGLVHEGTRFLDRYELRLNGSFPLLLSTAISADGSEHISHLTNADERRGDEVAVQRDTVAVERRKVLYGGALYESWRVRNFGAAPFALHLALLFTADFADIFELRGMHRERRGQIDPPRVVADRVDVRYRGLDGVTRRLRLTFSPAAWKLEPELAELTATLAPGAEMRAAVTMRCQVGPGRRPAARPDAAGALARLRQERQRTAAFFPTLRSSNARFDDWVAGSLRDLALLRADDPQGAYVYAGIPWFATVFGRDGLITAAETLAFAPEIAGGTLRRLAALQGQRDDPERDEAAGKILHELRHGEMAATGEIPFGRYYGSVDATPLFAALLAAYVERTADLALARSLWPAALAAMGWISESLDGRGYLTYARRSATGLVNQGWKDSHDAVMHADGRLAEPPIALCEVQGYVYAALAGMAGLAARLGEEVAAAEWGDRARRLRERFARDFWLEDERTYALALDGSGRPCAVVASNAGHCLFTGIASPEQARGVIERLLREDSFCGWGIRTLSAAARRYNPMSYHNGSVWPHDNAMIAAGCARYGHGAAAARILGALFAVSDRSEDNRLPELFCGFARGVHDHPVAYPVACRPQAWAAGAVFLLLQAILGLSIDAWKERIMFTRPTLPDWLDYLELQGLRLRDRAIDLRIVRGRRSAALEVTGKRGDIDVLVRK
jgi:glycogen debranching enzyme